MTATRFPNGIVAPILSESGTQGSAIADLTDSSGGTASDTLAAISATYSQSEVANSIASLAAKVNALIAALEAANIISTS